MATKSVAQEVRETVKNRLKEIRTQIGPLVAEESELVVMAPGESTQFSKDEGPKAEAKPKVKPPSATPDEPATRRRRRRKGGTRADQAVDFIAKNPGVSASDVAAELKIKPNYLYRVLGDLEKEGRVSKEGTKYSVASA